MKKFLSYFIPVKLKTYTSTINGPLEVTYSNGRKVLDTENSNYSYGSLQRILQKGLRALNFDKNIENVLVLGMGGGSIVETIRKKFNSEAKITLVDIDPEIISIAKEEFEIVNFKNLEIIQADAFDFVKNQKELYDLVIVDVFIIDTVPEIFTEEKFLFNLAQNLRPKGKLLYNTMRSTMERAVFNQLQENLKKNGFNLKIVEKVEGTNDLILGEKQ